ncbi:MAG: BREX-1 system phosphatase PglZ type B [Desulfobacterales bacterium]|nr:BREX-1 system phosphatase PglZ type B [Desulfobacterales bacterium]
MRVIEHLLKAIRGAAIFYPEVQVAPACVLWPDRDRQWEAIIPRVQVELPELYVLGDYDIAKRTGPAIWLRCVLAGKISMEGDAPLENAVKEKQTHFRIAESIPIIYLPGISRQDLRAVESCPDTLKPLAELQYRGVVWSQINGKDWTILSFLKSDQGGLGLDVAQDNDAKNAMQIALYRLLDEEISLLEGKRLDKDYFNTLLTGGDPIRDLLQWLDNADAFRAGRGGNEWVAFVEICKSQLGFNPQDEGPLFAAEKLATHEGAWKTVWERFCEAPNRYPNIPFQIRKCTMPLELFTNAQTHGGWPQWNERQEQDLGKALCSLSNMPAHKARERILELDKSHRERRKLIWVELGESPLALALRHLAILSEITSTPFTAGSAKDLASSYASTGWKADAAVLHSLSFVETADDLQAVTTAIRSVYMPWVEDSSRYLQEEIEKSGYPKVPLLSRKKRSVEKGECILFVDGLRYDLAQHLSELLTRKGYQISGRTSWVALPSLTATGKPSVSPVWEFIEGKDANSDFEPSVKETGQSLKGGYHLKKLLAAKGWTVLEKSESGDGNGHAWCEFGNIDHEGHERGWKLSKFMTGLISEISERVEHLLASGWKTVRVVTDHGWLLLPGGLPKTELPAALVENKWGRCAVIKPGAVTAERLFHWYWNGNQSIALSNGISCFKAGEEYAHGGLSLQECLTMELKVSVGVPIFQAPSVEITDIVWKGLRCKIAVDGDFDDLVVDIRMKAGSSEHSVVMNVKPINESGIGSVVVENEEFEGTEASIVLLDKAGVLIAQEKTIIGGGTD